MRCLYVDLDGTLLGRGASLLHDATRRGHVLPVTGLDSDAYGTGQSLYALMEGAKIPAGDRVVRELEVQGERAVGEHGGADPGAQGHDHLQPDSADGAGSLDVGVVRHEDSRHRQDSNGDRPDLDRGRFHQLQRDAALARGRHHATVIDCERHGPEQDL